MPEMFDFASKRASLCPDKVALVDAVTGAETSYKALNDRAEAFAAYLASQDVKAGETIALLSLNNTQFFEMLFGCLKAGVVLIPLNWRLTAHELIPIVEDAQVKLMIFDQANGTAAQAILESYTCPSLSVEQDYPALIKDHAQDLRPGQGAALDPDAVWYLLYTSGTTGKPKAVIQTPRMALANMTNIGQPIDLVSTDTTLNFLPMFHTAGINLYTLPVLLVGGTVYVTPKFELDLTFDLMASGKISTMFAVPAVYQALADHPKFAEADLSPVRSWGCGGAAMPEKLLRRYLERDIAICNGFGMTETGPTVFLMDEANVLNKVGSVGKPQLLADVIIADGQGQALGPDQDGELLIGGPGVTPGYLNRADATAEAFTEDGYLRSGDVARYDSDGYYYIVGRIKDMYISGGENVYPAEVEAVINALPGVIESAVIGVPDDQWGEVGCAFLLCREGAGLEAQTIVAHCKDQLAGYKVPRHVRFVDDFPRTAAGKVQKHLLADQY